MHKIRDAVQADIPVIAQLEHEIFSMPRNESQFYITDDRHVLLVVDDLSGYAGFTYVMDEGYIDNVAVRPEGRRKGHADELISALLKRSQELKLSFLTLEVRAGNEAAIGLYEKHGFLEEGRMNNYYSNPKEDAIIMTVRHTN